MRQRRQFFSWKPTDGISCVPVSLLKQYKPCFNFKSRSFADIASVTQRIRHFPIFCNPFPNTEMSMRSGFAPESSRDFAYQRIISSRRENIFKL